MRRSPGIYLAEDNYEKPQLGERLVKAVRPVIASNEVTYLQIIYVGSHSISERGRK